MATMKERFDMGFNMLAEGLLDTAIELLRVAVRQEQNPNGIQKARECEAHARECVRQCAEMIACAKRGRYE